MPRQVKSSEDELFALCDEIQAIDGKVTAARLRDAAGGGGHTRLKAVVEAWQERRDEAAKPTEDSVPEKTGRGRRQAGKETRINNRVNYWTRPEVRWCSSIPGERHRAQC